MGRTTGKADPLSRGYKIKPKHINLSRGLPEAFGNMETEASAGWIVRFFQQASEGRWRAFTYTEIDAFYRGNRLALGGGGNFTFNRLLASCHAPSDFVVFTCGQAIIGRANGAKRLADEPDSGFIAVSDDGKTYTPTHEFVSRCYGAAPAES